MRCVMLQEVNSAFAANAERFVSSATLNDQILSRWWKFSGEKSSEILYLSKGIYRLIERIWDPKSVVNRPFRRIDEKLFFSAFLFPHYRIAMEKDDTKFDFEIWAKSFAPQGYDRVRNRWWENLLVRKTHIVYTHVIKWAYTRVNRTLDTRRNRRDSLLR